MDARLNNRPRMFRAAAVATVGFAMACGLLILFGGLASPVVAAPLADTVISSDITGDTTWTPADSPYIISGTVSFYSGTLTISPNVTVRFNPSSELVIQTSGRLVAIGTSSQPITFTSNVTPTPASCNWDAIRFTSDNNILRYSLLEYATWGIDVSETSSGNDISYNTFRNNGLCVTSPVGGAIVGSPDDTTVISNTFTNNASVFYVAKASGNILAYNVVSGTTQPAIAFVRSGSTLSSDNRFYENTIRYAQDVALFLEWGIGNVITNNTIYSNYGAGVRLVTQDSANVLNNTIYGNAFTTTTGSGGVGHNEAGIVVEGKYLNGSTRVEDNAIYANGASGVSSYRAGLYVTGTQSVRITNNFIHDGIVNYGLDYGLNNTGSPVITGNAVCRDPSFELRSQQAGTLTAEGNWWGTNTPASEISGVVDYTPPIQLVLTPTTGAIPANGTSTTVITVAFNDGGGNLVPAALRTLTLTASAGTLTPTVVTVNSAGTATTSLRSTITPTVATVTATEWCGFAATTTVTFQVVDLSVSKVASLPPYGPGNLITYTISYRNNGNATANGVVLTETVPLSTTFVGPVGASGWFTATPYYTYSIGSLAPSASGSITFVVRITDTLPPGDALFTNVVQIGDNGALGADYTPADNVYTLTISGGNLPDLWAVKNDNVGAGSLGGAMVGALANTAGGPGILQMIHALDDIGAQQVPEGGLITYTIGYGNSSQGSANATGVVLSDTLPLYTTYAGPACGQPGGWCQIGATRNYTYPIGALNRGQGDYVYFTVRITNTLPSTVSEVVNTVCIDGAQNDLVPSNDCSSEQTEVISGTYDLSVTKVENATCLNPGDAFGYVITVRNQGTNNATNVILRETLPTNTTYLGLPGPAWTAVGGGVYTYSLGVLASSAVTTTQFWVQINAAPPPSVTSITNVVSVQASGTDSNPANDSFTLATPLGTTPDLVITKNDNTSGEIAPGGLITYTIVAVNASNRYTATNVVITETLPAGTVVTGSTALPESLWRRVGSSSSYTFYVGTIGLSGMPAVPDFIVQVSNPFTYGSEVVNQVQIRGAQAECDLADNTATEETPVQGANYADLAVTKDDDVPLCAVPGDVIAYTISYTNNSYTIPAANVVLTETIDPVAVTFLGPVGWSGGGTTYTRAATPSLATRASGTSIFNVQIAPTIPSGQDRITNVVRIGTTSTDWDLSNNIFTLTTSVPLWPDLIVVKNDNVGSLGASAQEGLDDILSRLQFSPQALALLQGSILGGSQVGAMAESVNPGDLITYTVILGNIGRASANSVVTETLPAGTTFVGPGYWQQVGSSNLYTYTTPISASYGNVLQFIVRVNNPFTGGSRVINTVQIGSSAQECDTANNTSTEETTVTGAANTLYLPIILKNYPEVPPTPTPTPPPLPTPTPPPTPLAQVSDVAVDPVSDRVYVASPRHDQVYVLVNDVLSTTLTVGVSHGPTGLDVFTQTASKVFVAHAYDWEHGARVFNTAGGASRLIGPQGGYVGAGPYRLAVNSVLNRAYVSNYYDKLAVLDAVGETRLGWVVQKGWQGAYGIDVSQATGRVYLASRDTGELVVFDGNGDRLLQSNYIPTHFKPPEEGGQGCSLYSVAVNERTGHVFVPCPARKKVYVREESDMTILAEMAAQGEIGTLEERPGGLALVIDAQYAGWYTLPITDPSVTNSVGKEGIAVDPVTNRVFIGDPDGDRLVVVQDNAVITQTAVTTVVPVGDNPQGVDVNPDLSKVYVGNAGSNTVTVLNAITPTIVITTVNLP